MKKLLGTGLGLATSLSLAATAFAATPVDPCPQGDGSGGNFNRLCSAFTPDRIGPMIGTIITFVLVIAVIIALFFLIWGGIRWILSGGDKGKVDAARSTIIAAIIGLIIAFLAYFVLQVVLNLFGLGPINELTLPTL